MAGCESNTASWHADLDNQIGGMPVYEPGYPTDLTDGMSGGSRSRRSRKRSKRRNKTKRRTKSRRTKSRRTKSRRTKSRRTKSRRTKSRRTKSRRRTKGLIRNKAGGKFGKRKPAVPVPVPVPEVNYYEEGTCDARESKFSFTCKGKTYNECDVLPLCNWVNN